MTGWFFDFKLHPLINHEGSIASFRITDGSRDDRKPLEAMTAALQELQEKIFAPSTARLPAITLAARQGDFCWVTLAGSACVYTLPTPPLPMVEPLLCGIVLGLVPITILGLFVSAYNQYRRQGGVFGG